MFFFLDLHCRDVIGGDCGDCMAAMCMNKYLHPTVASLHLKFTRKTIFLGLPCGVYENRCFICGLSAIVVAYDAHRFNTLHRVRNSTICPFLGRHAPHAKSDV